MVRPERRTKGDILAAATIVVVVAAAAALIWWTSDARATISRPAAVAAPNSTTPARQVPSTLKQLWTATTPDTTAPIVVGGAVVTGDGRQIDGRDPETGKSRWSYARDSDLCGVTWLY